MLNLAHSTRSALGRAKPVEFHEPSSVVHHRPRPAARPRAETGSAGLSQRGLGGSAARRRPGRGPAEGQPVRGARGTARYLRRRRGSEIRRRAAGPGSQWRVFDSDGEAVAHNNQPTKLVIARLDRAIQYAAAHRLIINASGILDHPLSRMMTTERYALSVSRNRTGSPLDGATSSPCHITRRPLTKVPTGQPVTRNPSYGVQPAREATHLLVMVSLRLRSTVG